MGHRITWRSRPRSDYPWPLRVKRVTETEFSGISGYGGANFIGPLNIAAVTELLYRVSKLRFEGVFTDTVDPATINIDVELPLDGISDELERFGECAYHFDGIDTQSSPFLYSSMSEFAVVELVTPNDYGAAEDFTGFDVIHVTDKVGANQFYLNGVINWLMDPPVLYVINRTAYPIASEDQLFNADLVLKSGTFPILMIADWDVAHFADSSTMTITATEWFPFKTKTGDPAWDTNTGAPANGGPGA